MFLNEVALGKENIVKTNQSHLKAAPAGYDSVLAIGCTEPGKFLRVNTFQREGTMAEQFLLHACFEELNPVV